jgi:lipoic acid synthetase
MKNDTLRKPEWLRIKLPSTEQYSYIKSHLKRHGLHTICESGNCPNQGECWAARTATFMILGDVCTRNCRFCAVNTGKTLTADQGEPTRIAEAVAELGIRHCVLTSVTRDDLEDGGADIWAATIRAVKEKCPRTTVEALIPDMMGNADDLATVIAAGADVVAHNIETVRRMTPLIRIKAKYDTSLYVLKVLADAGVRTKSGIMVGLGETDDEVKECIQDLKAAGCSILTIGQYLQPTRENVPVQRYVTPETFEEYKAFAKEAGIAFVESGPLVRSSYHAEKFADPQI